MNLKQLKIGERAKVKEVGGRDKERQHLLDMGLIPGTTVEAIKRAPMGDPLEISLHGYELAIRNSHAEKLVVEKLPKSKDVQTDIFDFCKE